MPSSWLMMLNVVRDRCHARKEPCVASRIILTYPSVGYQFDYVPAYFINDLLVHEAHRHPYIERLAQIYLMKLRHRSFGGRACAVWRQLVVISYFPWLAKYRAFDESKRYQAMQVSDKDGIVAENYFEALQYQGTDETHR